MTEKTQEHIVTWLILTDQVEGTTAGGLKHAGGVDAGVEAAGVEDGELLLDEEEDVVVAALAE